MKLSFKKTIKQIAKNLISFSIVLSLASCSMSTDELSNKVKNSMKEEFDKKGVVIKSLVLSKKTGNEYTGLLETSETIGTSGTISDFKYEVLVNYDGKNMIWKIVEDLGSENTETKLNNIENQLYESESEFQPYQQNIVDNFVNACSSNTGVTIEKCNCIINEIQSVISQDEFITSDAKASAGEKDENYNKMLSLASNCN